MTNRRRTWHQRLRRRLTVRHKAQPDDRSRSTVASSLSGSGHPLVVSAILYFLTASTALALGASAPALVLALAGTASLLCHGRRLSPSSPTSLAQAISSLAPSSACPMRRQAWETTSR
jgi:drug/metabolite transporter (DMT)-like permease